MKREAKLLLGKANDSLLIAIELFNRPYSRGRVCSTLIHLDHGFEMLMKAAILHRGGHIRDKRAKGTIGFDACVRRSLSDGEVRYLSEERALLLQTINGLRGAAQHHLLDISEGQLYVHLQSGVTLFRDLLKEVFDQDLASHLPSRVLPVSTSPPTDLATLFDSEVKEIRKLLQPGRRRQIEAVARLRPLAILDATIRGEKGQPSDSDLRRIGKRILHGKDWGQVFQGAAAVEISREGSGPTLSLRLSKKKGIPIQLVPEGTPDASVVAVNRVDELGFYNLGATQLAKKSRAHSSDGIGDRRRFGPSQGPGVLQGNPDRGIPVQTLFPKSYRFHSPSPIPGTGRGDLGEAQSDGRWKQEMRSSFPQRGGWPKESDPYPRAHLRQSWLGFLILMALHKAPPRG